MDQIEGIVEYVGPKEVRGWVFDQEKPSAHLTVIVELDQTVVATVRADQFREDLRSAGKGDGDHGFVIAFQGTLPREQLLDLKVYSLTSAGTRQVLPSGPGAVHAVESYAGSPDSPALPTPFPIVEKMPQDDSQFPVFVLGAARSGTSALAQALLKCGAYQGFEEGHFLGMLQNFLQTIGDYYTSNGEDASPDRFTMLSRIPYSYMSNAVRQIFLDTARAMFPTGRWVDKTPSKYMTRSARLMQELWPNARFIFMKRRGIENVRSRIIKFPGLSFSEHCKDWAAVMESWLSVRDLLGGSALEIEQLAVLKQPTRISTELGRFLDISSDATSNLMRSLAFDRPEKTAEPDSIHQDEKAGWPEEQWRVFREICGPMMAAYGYSYTDRYFADRFPSLGLE